MHWKAVFDFSAALLGLLILSPVFRKVIGWAMSNRMTVDLVERAMQMAITLRRPADRVIYHSDRGSQL